MSEKTEQFAQGILPPESPVTRDVHVVSYFFPISEAVHDDFQGFYMQLQRALNDQYERRMFPETYTLRYRLRRRFIWIPQAWFRGVTTRFRDAYSVLRGRDEIYNPEIHDYREDEW